MDLLRDSRLTHCDRLHFQVWTKHNGQPAYRKEAKLYLPGKTVEEIEEHEDWYHELMHLQDRKREVEDSDSVFELTEKADTICKQNTPHTCESQGFLNLCY